MNDSQKQIINGTALVVISTILTIAVAFLCWTARSVYELHANQAAANQQAATMAADIKDLKDKGSPIVQSLMARLDSLTAGQARMESAQLRIEAALVEHMKESGKKP